MMNSLKSFVNKPKVERCDLCREEVAKVHQHLIDPLTRRLMCSCDACALLFDFTGTTQYKRIPRDAVRLNEFKLTEERWKNLLVPIQLGFLYRSSYAKKVVALYPSPAGVTEAEVDQGAWERITSDNPRLESLREDIEALLVNRMDGERSYYIAPMDRCFELVGLVRTHWKGINGGDQVWQEVDHFLRRLVA